MPLGELNPIEATWLVISFVGLVFAAINLADARSDVTAARMVFNYRRTTRLALAAGRVHRNWVRVAVFVGWTLLGILFGFFEVPRILGTAGLAVLIIGAAGQAYTGYQEARERREIAKLLAEDVATDVKVEHDASVAEAEHSMGEQ
jgi:uncharacterized membrane protein